MCDKCQELDRSIDRYQKIVGAISNPVAIQRICRFLEDLIDRKAKLHFKLDHHRETMVRDELASVKRQIDQGASGPVG